MRAQRHKSLVATQSSLMDIARPAWHGPVGRKKWEKDTMHVSMR